MSEEALAPDDYECRSCHAGLSVPDGMDPLEEDVRFCHSCAITEIERLRAVTGRINHFATGTCDMPHKTRLACIAKECQSVIE